MRTFGGQAPARRRRDFFKASDRLETAFRKIMVLFTIRIGTMIGLVDTDILKALNPSNEVGLS